MKRLLLTVAVAALSAALSPVGHAAGALHCTLTNRDVDACCCQSRNGKLYCTLANREIPSCCCTSRGNALKHR